MHIHRFVNCEQTFIFNVKNHFSKNRKDLIFEGQTLLNQRFQINYSDAGCLKKVIKEMQIIQESYVNPNSDFFMAMKELREKMLENGKDCKFKKASSHGSSSV